MSHRNTAYRSSRRKHHAYHYRYYALFLCSLLMNSSSSFPVTVRICGGEPRSLLLLRRWMSPISRPISSSSSEEEEEKEGTNMSSNKTNDSSTRNLPVYQSSLMKQRTDRKKHKTILNPNLLPSPPSISTSAIPNANADAGGSDGSALPNLPSWDMLFPRTVSPQPRHQYQQHQATADRRATTRSNSNNSNNNARKIRDATRQSMSTNTISNNNNNNKIKKNQIQPSIIVPPTKKTATTTSKTAGSLLPPLSQLFGLNKKQQRPQQYDTSSSSSSHSSSLSYGFFYNYTDKTSLLLPNFTFYEDIPNKMIDKISSNTHSLDGVLPVSELFYRSTQAMSSTWPEEDEEEQNETEDGNDEEEEDNFIDDYDNESVKTIKGINSVMNINNNNNNNNNVARLHNRTTFTTKTSHNKNNHDRNQDSDDNELPFSAEQSDQILIHNNKVKVRRNLIQENKGGGGGGASSFTVTSSQEEEEEENNENEETCQQDDELCKYPKSNGEIPNNDTIQRKPMQSILKESSSVSSSFKNPIPTTPLIKPLSSYPSLEDKENKTKKSTSAKKKGTITSSSSLSSSSSSSSPQQQLTEFMKDSSSFSKSMKMVRRGMEMLVGGVPINVDPPLRFIELNYNFSAVQTLINPTDSEDNIQQPEATPWAMQQYNQPHDEKEYEKLLQNKMNADWASIITTNSRDFGPLLHGSSVPKTSPLSRELYCEYMSMAFVKWNVGPKDYEELITSFEQSVFSKAVNNKEILEATNKSVDTSPSSSTKKPLERIIVETKSRSASNSNIRAAESTMSPPSSFQLLKEDDVAILNDENDSKYLKLGGDLKFTLDISRIELESMFNGTPGLFILSRVIRQGLAKAIKADSLGFDLILGHIYLNELDGGATEFTVEFHLKAKRHVPKLDAERAAKKINCSLAQAIDDGEVALAMGAAAKMEYSWPDELRERVVEEFLFEVQDADDVKAVTLGDDDDFESSREMRIPDIIDSGESRNQSGNIVFDGPFGMPGDAVYGKNDIFLGGGNGGVFYDYSEKGVTQAPFKGGLGPLMLDAVIQRFIQRQPRLIVIGDVHGCIDELQALLRKCDYRIGDLVLFLGDLVSKGPDSLSVVQMAREIGAIGVRGNHDFEVIRWHQAMKSGADPPVIGSEHFQIAMQLSKADLRWMYSLPWYISSKDLGALFVHAGFVSGIRLAKQNPRLLMNMRSILPDGTVTSKFFKSWPWARLWDGPQTVFFGHDADRDLQSYEHAIGLDTGCVYGGRLTACILPEKRIVSVSAKRQYFQYRRRQFD